MVKRFIRYTGVTKKWRNRHNYSKHSWGWKYARETINGMIVLKEQNNSRLVDYKKALRTKALQSLRGL